MLVQRVLMHRAWLPIVGLVTLGAVATTLALRAATPVPVAFAGCYGPEKGPVSGVAPDGVFRWTKQTAAIKVAVRGPVLVVPVYLARPDIADGPIGVRITLDGVHTSDVRFSGNGWHTLGYDLVEIAGAAAWSRMRSLTVTFDVSRTVRPSALFASDDHRDLGIGLGDPKWSATVPLGALTPASDEGRRPSGGINARPR